MPLALIAAVARNGVIGDRGMLPWRLPEDLAFFRRSTQGHPVIMGRKTWDSLPERFRPLPGRRNIVVTRQAGWQAEGAVVAHDLAGALAQARAGRPDDAPAFVIGGAALYALALPEADTLMLTEIDRDVPGDTRFPGWPERIRAEFTEVQRERHPAAAPNDFEFSFVTWRRHAPRGGPPLSCP